MMKTHGLEYPVIRNYYLNLLDIQGYCAPQWTSYPHMSCLPWAITHMGLLQKSIFKYLQRLSVSWFLPKKLGHSGPHLDVLLMKWFTLLNWCHKASKQWACRKDRHMHVYRKSKYVEPHRNWIISDLKPWLQQSILGSSCDFWGTTIPSEQHLAGHGQNRCEALVPGSRCGLIKQKFYRKNISRSSMGQVQPA